MVSKQTIPPARTHTHTLMQSQFYKSIHSIPTHFQLCLSNFIQLYFETAVVGGGGGGGSGGANHITHKNGQFQVRHK